MTREEAIKGLKILKEKVLDARFESSIDMAIKALEQEPCAGLKKEIEEMQKYLNKANETNTRLFMLLEKQKPKTGHWILVDEESNTWKCTNCIKEGKDDWWRLNHETPQDNKMHYCPHCGAKMESEE